MTRWIAVLLLAMGAPAAAQGPAFGKFEPSCRNPRGCTATELQEAIDDASRQGGGAVQVPCGDHYLGATTLTVPAYVALEGCSHRSQASALYCVGTTCVEIAGDFVALRRLRIQDNRQTGNTRLIAAALKVHFEIEDLMLRCAGSRSPGAVGIHLRQALKGRISGVLEFGCGTGILLEDRANANLLEGVNLQDNLIGLRIVDDGSHPGCREVTLLNPAIEGNALGISLESDCLVSIHGGHFEQRAQAARPPADIEASAGRLAIFGTRFADSQPGQTAIYRKAVGSEYTEPDIIVGGKLSDALRYEAGALELLDVDLAPSVVTSGDVRRIRGAAAFTECQTLSDPSPTSDRALWRAPQAATLLDVWCEVPSATATIRLLRDDGSPASVLEWHLPCIAGGATGTLQESESHFAANDRLDLDVVSTTGNPRSLTVCASLRND